MVRVIGIAAAIIACWALGAPTAIAADKAVYEAFVWKHLEALREPNLRVAAADPSVESYRLLLLPSFSRPLSIRLSVLPSGAAVAIIRTSTGKGGYEPGTLATDHALAVTQERLGKIRAAMGEQIFSIPMRRADRDAQGNVVEQITCTDGTLAVIEGVRAGRHHIVVRSCVYGRELVDVFAAFRAFYPPWFQPENDLFFAEP